MLIGVVSDTHGHVHYTQQAIRMLESLEVERVIHCGDIGSAEIPPMFSRWPADFVVGNVDRPASPLRDAVESTDHHLYHGVYGEFRLGDVLFAVLHGDDPKQFREAMANPLINVICYGHTHKAESRLENGKLILNPGALYRATPHSIAVVELDPLKATIVALD